MDVTKYKFLKNTIIGKILFSKGIIIYIQDINPKDDVPLKFYLKDGTLLGAMGIYLFRQLEERIEEIKEDE